MEPVCNIATNVAAEIITSSIKKAATQVRYLYCFNDIVETLEKEKKDLIREQGGIKERVKRAHRRTETIGTEVQKWLEDAENLITDVDQLQQETGMHSVVGCCPNCFKRYRLGRRAAKKTRELTQLKGNCTFSEFSRLATLRGMENYSSEGFISFESRKHAYNQIMEALKDEGIHRIGLHGMGGCGKTTLVKEVGKEAEKLELFEKVIIVVVSNYPDIRKIQSSIAGSLGLKFEEKNEPEKAIRLSKALKSGGKILIILDDVWQNLNFEEVGIPNNCHFLLTTRNSSVCSTMDCQKVISLHILDETESWILFQNHARINDDKFDTFKDVAEEILNECKGLPIAIAAVASSLKGKELVHWEVARDMLKGSIQEDIEPALEDIYKCLKLSYDNIRGKGVKSLFLLCSLFPEDYEILVEKLTRYAMGLRLFGNIQLYERTRNQVSVAINKLIDSCLLLNGDERNTIKMHDLVHDIALQIAKIENKIIIEKEISKNKSDEHSILKDDQIRYLFLEMDEFPQQLHCPKLECLVIYIHLEDEVVTSDGFFNEMKDLRVLTLSCKQQFIPPRFQWAKSIKSLTKLSCLTLNKWRLGDLSFVGSLSTIEALTLYSCSFNELPDSVTNLKNLRLLDLVKCKIGSNPYGVIQRCSKLEELYFVDNEYPEREEEGEYNFEFFGKLQRYHIEIGESFDRFDHENYSIRRYLSVEDFEAVSSCATIVDLVRRAEVLCLGGIDKGCKSIIPNFVEKIRGGMNELTRLKVHHSNMVECVVDMTISFHHIGTVFSNLTYLKISKMQHLKELFLGQPHHGLLQKLEELHIHGCNQLKHIIANEFEIIPDGDNLMSHNSIFPKLKVIAVRDCNELECLMPISFAKGLLELENVKITNASELKYVFGQSNYKAKDQSNNQNLSELHIIKLQALKYLRVESLPNIISICPENYYPVCPSLVSLELKHCSQLIIIHDELEFRQLDQTIGKNGIVFCNLTKLDLCMLNSLETLFLGPAHLAGFEKLQEISIKSCSQLKHLIASDGEKINSEGSNLRSYDSIFRQLKVIYIIDCEQLEYLMPVSFARGLLKLERLEVSAASQLKYIFCQSNYEAEDQSNNQNLRELHIIRLQALEYLTLSSLANIVSICPDNYNLFCPSLVSMNLTDCPQLNVILDELEFKQLDQTIGKNGILFGNLAKQIPSLEFLRILKIEACRNLKVLFSVSILRSLNQLALLKITWCEELQQIIQVDASNPHSGLACLPRLTTLIVQQCSKLKCLFSFSTSIKLPNLKFLIIEESFELEEVIACEKGNRKEQVEVDYPELELLVLAQLPSLCEVYRGIELETVRFRVVHHCPKLSLMQAILLRSSSK